MIRMLLAIALISTTTAFVLADDYELIIDGRTYEISLDKTHQIKLADGQRVNVKLKRKPIAQFKTDFISFEYPVKYTPSRTKLEKGLYQTMMMTPTGTGIMIQEYRGINPTALVDLMLNEITKEQREYGYTIKTTPVSKMIADGKTLTGKKATCTYQGDKETYTVYGYGRRDEGVIILLMENDLATQDEVHLIRLFMESASLFPATGN